MAVLIIVPHTAVYRIYYRSILPYIAPRVFRMITLSYLFECTSQYIALFKPSLSGSASGDLHVAPLVLCTVACGTGNPQGSNFLTLLKPPSQQSYVVSLYSVQNTGVWDYSLHYGASILFSFHSRVWFCVRKATTVADAQRDHKQTVQPLETVI